MTLGEFKAWLEGFTEDMEGPPNARQWKRIQSRIKAINDLRITERVIREWWPGYERPRRVYGIGDNGMLARSTASLNAAPPSGNGVGAMAFSARGEPTPNSACQPVDIVAELRALGKADAASLAA